MTPHPPSPWPGKAAPAGSSEGDPAGIDLTPMLDVVFILLIFFLVTANFTVETTLPLRKGDAESAPGNASITLSVLETGFAMDGQSLDIRSIPGRLMERLASTPDAQVSVLVSPSSTAEQLVQVMDAARRVGVMDLPVIALPADLDEALVPAVDRTL